MHRRQFFASAAGAAAAFQNDSAARAQSAASSVAGRTADTVARDEDFWFNIRHAFVVDRNLINLNNGGVSPSPKTVIDTETRLLEMENMTPTYYMWRILDPGVENVRRRLARAFGCDPEEIAITRNASEALENVQFGLELKRGDEVITTNQDYPRMISSWQQREDRDGIVLKQITFPVPPPSMDDLTRRIEQAITPKTRVILLNSPSNPTGAVFTAEEVAAIGALAKKHDLWIVSDEVYATMVHEGHTFFSPFFDKALEERVIVCSSISKSHALPGFRAGWIAASSEFCERVLPVSETLLFGSPQFLQDATAFALSHEFAETENMRAHYVARGRALIDGLAGSNRVSAHMPEGGMFVMVDVRRTGLSGEVFAFKLLREKGVVTMPGESFGAGGAGHLRVALTVPETEMRMAAQRIAEVAAAV